MANRLTKKPINDTDCDIVAARFAREYPFIVDKWNSKHKGQGIKKALRKNRDITNLVDYRLSPETRSSRPFNTYDGIAKTCALNIRILL